MAAPNNDNANNASKGVQGEGKVVILSGASRGIGQAIAHTLLTHSPANKLVVLSRTAAALDQLLTQYGADRVAVLAGDLADPKLGLATQAVELAISRWGRVDGLVVNHGTLDPVSRIADADVQQWRKGYDVNVFSAVELIRASIPALRSTRGRIILVSSGAAITPYQGWAAYGSSKAVLNHLASTLAVEEPLIATLAIRPGVVDTDMQRDIRDVHAAAMSETDQAKFKGLKEQGGLLRPDQPGGVIARLCVGGEEVVKGLSGKFLSWNDGALEKFQG